jgi:flagellar basal-body rod protein FlgB
VEASSVKLMVRLLGACETRARVVSANIANSNTPGYTRRVVRFEELLSSELRRGGDTSDIAPEVMEDVETAARPDGNNVSLELELNSMRENRLLYESYSAILRSHFTMMENALSG